MISRADEKVSATRPIMEAKNLHFAYPGGKSVISGASLQLERGTLAALIGPNGCGKSTLVRLLMRTIAPLQGDILFEGRPLHSIPGRELAQRVAYVPQMTAMTFPFSALEVVLTGRSPYTADYHFETGDDLDKARRSLAAAGALHLESRRMTELSGGERQLIMFARALAQEPDCLLLDEPSAALDLKHRAEMLRLLRLLRDQEGLTALVVTHDLQQLDPGFDHIFAMRSGEIIAHGPAAHILSDAILAKVYDDPLVRSIQVAGRTFVWSEA